MLPKIDAKGSVKQITEFIKQTVTTRGFQKAIIAVSGGVDSATSLCLACRALGADNVLTLQLPFGQAANQTTKDGLLAIEACAVPQANRETIDIRSAVNLLLNELGIDQAKENNRIRIGNIMARMRMIMLFDRAKKHHALVLGTENRSEHLLGYYTRYGDEASDIEPIQHLYKTQVYELARFLKVPEPILAKNPTAGLWAGQTDEGQFGFTYKIADQILYALFDQKLSDAQLLQQGFTQDNLDKVRNWVSRNHFKHEVPFVYKNSQN